MVNDKYYIELRTSQISVTLSNTLFKNMILRDSVLECMCASVEGLHWHTYLHAWYVLLLYLVGTVDLGKGLFEISNDIIDEFGTDGDTDQILSNTGSQLFWVRKLLVSGEVWSND